MSENSLPPLGVLYILTGPAAGTPAEEEGQAAEQLIHHEGDPAAGESQPQADTQNIGKQDAHGPGGKDGNHHGKHHITGTAQEAQSEM